MRPNKVPIRKNLPISFDLTNFWIVGIHFCTSMQGPTERKPLLWARKRTPGSHNLKSELNSKYDFKASFAAFHTSRTPKSARGRKEIQSEGWAEANEASFNERKPERPSRSCSTRTPNPARPVWNGIGGRFRSPLRYLQKQRKVCFVENITWVVFGARACTPSTS